MNRDEQFEQRLRRQPLRQVPPAWRTEILAQAKAAAGRQLSLGADRPAFTSALRLRLLELLWPCPQAWAGLAAAWVAVLAVQMAISGGQPVTETRRAESPSPELRRILKQQNQMLAELGGAVERLAHEQTRSFMPQPRSQKRQQLINT